MNSGVSGNILLPSFPRRREPTVPSDFSLLDPRLRGNDGFVHASLWKQRGAGTLMATVFLLLIVALLGGIGLRMASTDINDTAVQNDSAEALFLAESGVERALQKLAAGTVCGAAVADMAAQSLGRGTFQITSAAINAGLCRVQVLGSVGLTGVTPATRLIEADLSLGGCRGWAVGSTSGSNEVLLCWNGTSWSRSGPYAAIPNTTLRGVTCPASNDCWAVGSRSGGGLIVHWDGTTWSRVPSGPLPNENLYGVHCYDSNNCWAVGNSRTFVRWNGVSWNAGSTAPGFPNTRMNAVYCAAALDCWAVGDDTGGEVIAHWTGGSWSRVATSIAIPNAIFRSITCPSTNDCWTVGDSSGGDNFNHWDNITWSNPSPYLAVADVDFYGVHCVAGNDCWAVGDTSGNNDVIAHWNGGSWSSSSYAGVSNNRRLYAIYAVNSSEGYVVGANGLIATWNGSTWADQASPVGSTLRAVTMAPAGGGTVAVQRWREIIQ